MAVTWKIEASASLQCYEFRVAERQYIPYYRRLYIEGNFDIFIRRGGFQVPLMAI